MSSITLIKVSKIYLYMWRSHKSRAIKQTTQNGKLAPTTNATYVISKNSRDGACISRPTQHDIPLSLAGPILLTSLGFSFSEDLGIARDHKICACAYVILSWIEYNKTKEGVKEKLMEPSPI